MTKKKIKRKNQEPKKRMGQLTQLESGENEKICWSFSILDYDGAHGWGEVSFGNHKEKIFDKLASFETMSWAEIKKNKKNNHSISKENLIPSMQKRLIELEQDDIDELFSLRLDGTKRVFGVRDRRVLKLLWWDPDHAICLSNKK